MAAERVGQNLRAVRRRLRLSLREVSERSHDEFRASTLGAYERGDRAISVARIIRLAEIYGVSIDEILPHEGPPERSEADAERGEGDIARAVGTARTEAHPTIDLTAEEALEAQGADTGPGTIDLTRLEALHDGNLETIRRYVQTVQSQRGSRATEVLSIRSDDLSVLAATLGRTREELVQLLLGLGVLSQV